MGPENTGANVLSKLESGYLSLLRAVILVAATVSLVVAGIAIVVAIPRFIESTGMTQIAELSGGTLADFVEQQKSSGTGSMAEDAATDAAETTVLAFPEIQAAAKDVKIYLGQRSQLSEDGITLSIQKGADGLAAYAREYSRSVQHLAAELRASKGKPLSERRVFQLLDWHHQNFGANIERREADKAAASAQFWMAATMAGSAFLAFILTVFVFLFVKIERNLRLVKMTTVSEAAAEPTYE